MNQRSDALGKSVDSKHEEVNIINFLFMMITNLIYEKTLFYPFIKTNLRKTGLFVLKGSHLAHNSFLHRSAKR